MCIRDRLREIGLAVPQITNVMDMLKDAGLDVPDGIYTPDDAFEVPRPFFTGDRTQVRD